MKPFVWDKNFITGLTIVDEHHLGLVDVINEFVTMVSSGEDVHIEAIDNTLNKLSDLLITMNSLFQHVSERNRELTKLNLTLEQRVEERTRELVDANEYLAEMALTDQLTMLPNRRHAMQSLSKSWKFSVAQDVPLSMIIIDADNFKQINDNYGHDAGDEALKALSNQLVNAFRTDDMVCRMGGDEFMVICHNTPLEEARKSVAEMKVKVGDSYWHGSISLGVATRTPETNKVKELIKLADDAVYLAKHNGRNLVCSC